MINLSREKQNEISKEKILRASLNEFGKKDYLIASTNNICKDNNISKGLLFHYYQNKDELFLLCVKSCFNDLSNYIKNNITYYEGDPRKSLDLYMKRRWEFFQDNAYYKQIFINATFNPPSHLVKEISILKKDVDEANKEFLLKCINSCNLKDNVTPDKVVDIILDLINHLHTKFMNRSMIDESDTSQVLNEWVEEFSTIFEMLMFGIIK